MPFLFPRFFAAFVACAATVFTCAANPDDPSMRIGPEPIDPASVIVLANSDSSDSLRVARHFIQLRAIPSANLIALPMPTEEKIDRATFDSQIRAPLLRTLVERALLNAVLSETEAGVPSLVLLDNPLRYMVTCFGVPAHITGVAELDDSRLRSAFFRGQQAGLATQFASGPLAKNEAAVDAELTLVLKGELPLNGFIPNPFFMQNRVADFGDLLKVTRLDGPSANAILRMLDRTLQAEATGLKGRAYADEDGRTGNYLQGNQMIARSAEIFAKLGFDLSHNTEARTFDGKDRFDAPALYAGWYARSANGPFTLHGFEFPIGAIAVHLHSFSATPLRSKTTGWVGPFVERGVSATVGNTAEPYLSLTHHFHVLFTALAQGWPFADAAYAALPGLSWQGIAVGDPFYRPFLCDLDQQLKAVGNPLQALTDQYVFLRKVNLLLAANEPSDAAKFLKRGMFNSPGPALGLRRAQYLALQDDANAANALNFVRSMAPASPADAALFADIAAFLMQHAAPKDALAIFRSILDLKNLPKPLRIFYTERAIPIAEAARDFTAAREWRATLIELSPPPPPPK